MKAALQPPAAASEERQDYEVSRVLEVRGNNALVLYSGWPRAEWTPVANVPVNLLPS